MPLKVKTSVDNILKKKKSLFFLDTRRCHFLQDNLHEPILGGKNKENYFKMLCAEIFAQHTKS